MHTPVKRAYRLHLLAFLVAASSLVLGDAAYGRGGGGGDAPMWSDPDRRTEPGQTIDPETLAKDLKKGGRPDVPELEDVATEDGGPRVESPFKAEVPDPTARAPKIDLPKDVIIQRPSGTGSNGVLKSSLVQINKSGLKPQVLKKPTGGGSVKGMGITFKTSLQTGAASLSVPIALPPGRRGLAPGLGLGYSSGGSQGIVGQGWSLGVGFIARQTDQGLPQYDGYDRFVYNGGQELVRVNSFGSSYPDSTLGSNYWIYRSKIEGLFWRFFRVNPTARDEYWVAQDRDGTFYTFGNTQGSRMADSGGDRTFRWNLRLVEDVHGNQVYYEYATFADSPGQLYLEHIRYNNHPDDGSRWQHHVLLTYETRPDVLRTYQAGYPVVTGRRLAKVEAFTDYGFDPGQGFTTSRPSDADGRFLVRRYVLAYRTDRYHSLLNMVQLYGSDGTTSLPPAVFTYQEVADSGSSSVVSVGDLGEMDTEVRSLGASPDGSVGTGRTEIMDLDSDGLPDILFVDPSSFGNDDHRYILGVGTVGANGRITPYLDQQRTALMGFPGLDAEAVESRGDHQHLTNTNVQILDLDGDGVVEMVHMPRAGTYEIYKLDCTERVASADTGPTGNPHKCTWVKFAEIAGHPAIDLTVDAEEIKLVDVNGDGLTDVVRTAGTRMEHWINLGRYATVAGDPNSPRADGRFGSVLADGTLSDDPVTSCLLYKGGYIRFSDPRIKLADMNGDGLQDIVLVDFGQVVWWPNKGWGQWGEGANCPATQTGANRHRTMANPPYMAGFDAKEVRVGDVNGDGLADLLRVRNTVVDVWLSKGDGYQARTLIQPAPFSTGFSNRVRLADVNGSGSRDLLWGDAGEYRYIDFTGGVKPRLLVHVENGLGATTEISYESSTAQYLRARDEDKEWFHTCPFPTQVVTKVVSRDNFGSMNNGWQDGVYTTKYRYFDCHWDGLEHEFRGFGETLVESVGDQNSPTSFVRHRFYQSTELDGYVDESLTGLAYRVDTWGNSREPGIQHKIHLSTSWTGYGVRTVDNAPNPGDARPGLHPDFHRFVRFAYARESHTFGYDTYAQDHYGSHSPHTVTGILAVRLEDAGGGLSSDPDAVTTADLDLPVARSLTTHLKSDKEVDDLNQTEVARVYGRLNPPPGFDPDPVIAKYATYVANEKKWIHRACESWVQEGTGQTASYYNRSIAHYDGNASSFVGQCAPNPSAPPTCTVGDKGLATKGQIEECYNGARVRIVDQYETEFTAQGLPFHTRAFKKMEGWVHYDDPRGYKALPTREVIRVGTDAPTSTYPETPVKFLTTRVSYDPGFGLVTEYRDENDQKSKAVYDPLGRLAELWGPREPKSTACADSSNPTFFKVAEVEYHLTPGDAPYSYVVARTFEDACDSSDVKTAWSYTDGLGRVRMTVGEADEDPEGCQDNHIASGFAVYDGKGAKAQVRDPGYIGFDPGDPVLPAPLADTCPGDDDSMTPCSVCTVHTRFDAFGRAVETELPNGDTSRTEFHGPLETWSFDGNDTGASAASDGAFVDTPSKVRKDGHGRVIQTEVQNVTKAHSDGSAGAKEYYFTGMSYDGLGNLISLRTCMDGQAWRHGDPNGCAAADRIEKIQGFDSVGQRRLIVDPDAGTWTFEFDEAGNLEHSFDGKWNAANPAEPGSHIRYVYDAANRLIQEICVNCVNPANPGVPRENDVLVSYYYDSPVAQSNGRGYMALQPDPADDEPQDWVLGRIARIEDETGWVMFSYDRLGRQVTEAQHIEVNFSDGGAPLTGAVDVYIGRVAYDDAGRVVQLTYPDPDPENAPEPSSLERDGPLVLRYTYTRRGLLSSISGPDPLDKNAVDPYVYLADVKYNAKGQRYRYEHRDASNIKTDLWYDRLGRLRRKYVRQTVKAAQASVPYDLLHRKFSYDAASNITAIEDLRDFDHVNEYTGGKNLPYDLDIQHDALYRVTRVRYLRKPDELANDPSLPDLRREMRYAYSAVGNLTQRSTTDGDGVENPAPEFYEKWLTHGADILAPAAHPHAFGATTADPSTATRAVWATYDANGNMTRLLVRNQEGGVDRLDRFEYVWDHYDRLVSVRKFDDSSSGGGAQTVEAFYSYDSGGQRVGKREQTPDDQVAKETLYISDGLELRNLQHMRYVFDGERRIARIGVAEPYKSAGLSPFVTRLVFVGDHLRSTTVVVQDHEESSTPDSDVRCVVSTASYLPYGGSESSSSSELCGVLLDERYSYNGKEKERALGIYYFGARYLNPAIATWTSVDSYYLFTNRISEGAYIHVQRNPYKNIDLDGNRTGPSPNYNRAKAPPKPLEIIIIPTYVRTALIGAARRYKKNAARQGRKVIIPRRKIRTGRQLLRTIDHYLNRKNVSRLIILSHGTPQTAKGYGTIGVRRGKVLSAAQITGGSVSSRPLATLWSSIKRKLKNVEVFLLGCNTASGPGRRTVVSFERKNAANSRSGSRIASNAPQTLGKLFAKYARKVWTVRGFLMMYRRKFAFTGSRTAPVGRDGVRHAAPHPGNPPGAEKFKPLGDIVQKPSESGLVLE